MSVARHDYIPVGLSQADQARLDSPQTGQCFLDDLLGVEPHVQRYLVVAGAAGMQPATGGADFLGQPVLDVHVQVFQGWVPGKAAILDFLLDSLQTLDYLIRVFSGNYLLSRQHAGVGDGTSDIVAIQPTVVMDRYSVVGIIGH